MKKKKIVISLATLIVTLGISGTLVYEKSKSEPTKDRATNQLKADASLATESQESNDISPPIIEGQKNWEVYQGEEIDVLTGVTAKDHSDKNVKLITTSYTTDKVGEQQVILTAVDTNHNKTSKNITVNVKPLKKNKTLKDDLEPVAQELAQEIVEQQPVYEEVEQPKPTAVVEKPVQVASVKVAEPTWAPSTMYVGGIAIPYQNAGQVSGQGVIDSNPNVIATWGGAVVQSGNDGANTHFIGHNPGIFNILFSLGGGSEIVVTDGYGTPTSYFVNQIVQVDDYATRVDTGQSFVDEIVGTGGGERITLQTCINEDINLIVIAHAR